MKAIVVTKFIDKNTGKLREPGEVFILSKERFAELQAAGNYVKKVNE